MMRASGNSADFITEVVQILERDTDTGASCSTSTTSLRRLIAAMAAGEKCPARGRHSLGLELPVTERAGR